MCTHNILYMMADLSPTKLDIITERFATIPLFHKGGQIEWTGMIPV